jgi:DNA topoisomerase I
MPSFPNVTLLERLQANGIRRMGSPKHGFRYRRANGRPVARKEVERIRQLRIPPAWRHVAISPRARAHLQAVGQDARGRWQYRYLPSFLEHQQVQKYERMQRFARALPGMRQAVHRDLSRNDFSRSAVMALILRVLSTCFLRPGSQVYAKENGSIGLATLRPKHVSVKGDEVHFHFPGKSGQWQERSLRDRLVAQRIRKLLRIPGKEVFKYQDEDGRWVDVRRRDINAYIKEVMGETFTAKDFRTWAGTLICACCLSKVKLPANAPATARKQALVDAVKTTARQLGNTPAICRASYIYPSVLSSFERGRVLARPVEDLGVLVRARSSGLGAPEKALLTLLKQPSFAKSATAQGRRVRPQARLAARTVRRPRNPPRGARQ